MIGRFEPTEWVLVTDAQVCPFTEPQKRVLAPHGVAHVECSDPSNTDRAPCTVVHEFPALCNQRAAVCVTGFTASADEAQRRLDALRS